MKKEAVVDGGELVPALDHKGRRMTPDGREIPDGRPLEQPVRLSRQPSLVEMVRQQVIREVSLAAQAEGKESFEEADNFEVEDDPFPQSAYEAEFEPLSEVKARKEVAEKEEAAAAAAAEAERLREKAATLQEREEAGQDAV